MPRSLPTFFGPDPMSWGPAGPRVLGHPGRSVQTSFSGSSREAGRQSQVSRFSSTKNARPASCFPVPPAPTSSGPSFCLCLCLCLSLSSSFASWLLDSWVLSPSQLLSFHSGLSCPICAGLYSCFSLLFAWLSCFFRVPTGSQSSCSVTTRPAQ